MKKTITQLTMPLLALQLVSISLAQAEVVPETPAVDAKKSRALEAKKDETVQEVVVTSQRRAISVSDIAISEVAFTADQIKDKAVVRMADLQTAVPALVVVDSGLTSSVNIRGIGLSSGSPAVANGVATYNDGLFQPQIVTSSSFYDIANIEVLRGPQGTLVGSNSTGGAVLITTKNPEFGVSGGYAEFGLGNFNGRNLQGAVNVPLSDTFALRVAGNHRTHDSYYTDLGSYHNRPGMLDENAARLSLLWKPGQFQALLKIDGLEKKTGGAAYKPIPGGSNDLESVAGAYKLNYNSPSKFNESAMMTGLELRYVTDNGIVLRSLSGVQDKKVHAWWDLDATSQLSIFWDQNVRERQSSQEFNIISPLTGRFNWILGAYLQRNLIDSTLLQTDTGPNVNYGIATDKRSTGLFVQTGYKLLDNLELQTGVRRSTFKATGTGGIFVGRGQEFFPAEGLNVADLSGLYTDNMLTGKVALNWKADKNDLLYAFVARGYKPGNFNSQLDKFKPETVLNYELGWKANLAGGHIKTQFDLFYNHYKNFQLDVLDTSTSNIAPLNLAPSTIKGAEGQIQAKFQGLRIDAGFAYVDSNMKAPDLVDLIAISAGTLGPQCPAGTPSNPPICFDYVPYIVAGQNGPNLLAPKLTYTAGIDYTFYLDNGMSLTPRLNIAHSDGSYGYATYRANAYIKGSTTMSGQIALRRDNWSAELYGTNLTKQTYIVGVANNNNQFSGAPREFGVRLNLDF